MTASPAGGATLAELEQALETELPNVLLDLNVSRKNLAVARAGIAQAEENLRVTDHAYKAGVETATQELDAIFALARAHLNRVVARSAVFLNHYRLQRMIEGFDLPVEVP